MGDGADLGAEAGEAAQSGDNPVTSSDPTGLCPADKCGGGVPKGGAGGGYTNGPIDPSDPGLGNTWGGDSTSWARERVARKAEITHTIAVIKADEQRQRAELDALKKREEQAKQAQQEQIWDMALNVSSALLMDGLALVTEPIPGVDVATDAAAGYLDKEAYGEIVDGMAASGEDVATALEDTINSGESELHAEEEAVSEVEATAKTESEDTAGCANSFQGSTPVLMADGSTKPIDQVHVGDVVENAQPGVLLGSAERHQVTAVHVTHDDRAFTDVMVDTGHGAATITGTAFHLYWDTTRRSWTPADRLRIGDHLQSNKGGQVTIVALRDYATVMVTYNLTVDNLHAYYVIAGSAPVLVHNCGNNGLDFSAASKIEKQMGKRGWTNDSIRETINNPDRTVQTRDTRWGGRRYQKG